TGVVRVDAEPVLGFGLTRSYPWRTEWPRLVAARRTELVLALFGGWDGPTALAQGRDGYAQLVGQAVHGLRSQGANLVVLQFPPPDPAWMAGAWRADPRYDRPHGACT